MNFESVVDWIRSTVAEVSPGSFLLRGRLADADSCSGGRIGQCTRNLPLLGKPRRPGRQLQLQALMLISCFLLFTAFMEANGGRVGFNWPAEGKGSAACVLILPSDRQHWTEFFEQILLLAFQIIKDFYLLGRGELFQAFIDVAQQMLKTPPTAVTEHGEHWGWC